MPATQREEQVRKLPMTGAQYLESLRDGREIWLNGERVTFERLRPHRLDRINVARSRTIILAGGVACAVRTPALQEERNYKHGYAHGRNPGRHGGAH